MVKGESKIWCRKNAVKQYDAGSKRKGLDVDVVMVLCNVLSRFLLVVRKERGRTLHLVMT